MPVSAFKEKIAIQSGVPVGQQRLIFRGKVLRDEHRLSEYSILPIGACFLCTYELSGMSIITNKII